MTRRSTRRTWQDPRRVRRMAVVLLMPSGDALTVRCPAARMDRLAKLNAEQEPEEWAHAIAEAEYYLRELGRIKP